MCDTHARGSFDGRYYVRVWYERGQRRREYVRLEDVDEVRAKIERRNRRLVIERAERDRHMRRGEGGGRGGLNAYQRLQRGQLEHDEPKSKKRRGPETLAQKLHRLGFRVNDAGRVEWIAPD